MINKTFLLHLVGIVVAISISFVLSRELSHALIEVLAQISPYREFILGQSKLAERTVLTWTLLVLSVAFAFPYSRAVQLNFDDRVRALAYSLAFFALTISPFFYIVSPDPRGGFPSAKSSLLRDVKEHFVVFAFAFSAHSIVLSLSTAFLMSSIRNILNISEKSS